MCGGGGGNKNSENRKEMPSQSPRAQSETFTMVGDWSKPQDYRKCVQIIQNNGKEKQ